MTLRIGTLGAAKITPAALVQPARETEGVEVVAVAARDPERARAFAEEHGIPEVCASYDELVAREDLDVVYNPLPISHHCEWTIRALEAGKHVLCEKAFSCNAAEAERMADTARRTGLRLVEAFHYRYHPLMERVLGLVRGDEIGTLRELRGGFSVPFHTEDDIRFVYALGGGALMDLGCYPLHMVRHASGSEPQVVRAEAKEGPPQVDIALRAELRFPGGATGEISCSMESDAQLMATLELTGERGRIHVMNPLAPHIGHQLTVESEAGTTQEQVEGASTYTHQLRAFAAHVEDGAPVPTGPEDAIAQMRAIDAIYRAAGLRPRGG